jgi:diguanylate cyclase (GGDEF)-like protein
MSSLGAVVPLAVGGSVAAAGWALSASVMWRLRRQLRTDRLTGLPNRDALVEEFARATRRARRAAVGVVLLDLDGFKQVNDTHGHAAGNAVLQHVADRLTTVATDCRDLPARLHGDEFAVLVSDLPAGAGGLEVAHRRAARLAAAIGTPMDWAGREIAASASVGVAVAPAEHADLSILLHVADQRMYAHKCSVHAAEDAAAATATPSEISHNAMTWQGHEPWKDTEGR